MAQKLHTSLNLPAVINVESKLVLGKFNEIFYKCFLISLHSFRNIWRREEKRREEKRREEKRREEKRREEKRREEKRREEKRRE